MSKESIPLGTLCLKCNKYKNCRTLCERAEQYVNQDHVAQRDYTLTDMDIDIETVVEDFTTLISSSRYKGRGGQFKMIGQFHSLCKDKQYSIHNSK